MEQKHVLSQEKFIKAILRAIVFVRGIPHFPWTALKALQLSAIRCLTRAIKLAPGDIELIRTKLIELKIESKDDPNDIKTKKFLRLSLELTDELYKKFFPNKP